MQKLCRKRAGTTEAAPHARMIALPLEEAKASHSEGGEVVATGHNQRVQDGDRTAHGDCI
jgi:tRNA(Arg) A34 adenosine deaminase TadA